MSRLDCLDQIYVSLPEERHLREQEIQINRYKWMK